MCCSLYVGLMLKLVFSRTSMKTTFVDAAFLMSILCLSIYQSITVLLTHHTVQVAICTNCELHVCMHVGKWASWYSYI